MEDIRVAQLVLVYHLVLVVLAVNLESVLKLALIVQAARSAVVLVAPAGPVVAVVLVYLLSFLLLFYLLFLFRLVETRKAPVDY